VISSKTILLRLSHNADNLEVLLIYLIASHCSYDILTVKMFSWNNIPKLVYLDHTS